MMTHIPLITTTGRTNDNPGDTFIGVGLQYLFEQVLGHQVWVLIDRFSPKGFRDYEDVVRNAPFLVYGGMPQYNNYDDWKHWYDEVMWRDFIIRWGLEIFTMAGGAGFSHPDISVDAYVAYCMKSKKTERIIRQRVEPSLCFTVRDAYAHALLNALEIPNSYLPCSAVWASKMWNIAPAEQRPYLILVPPSPRHTPKRIGRRRIPRATRFQQFADSWKNFYEMLKRNGHDVRVLCHAYREYTALRDAIPSEALWFHGDPYTLLRQYASAHTVVSARLHGSLPAYGICGTRVLNLSVDVRGSAVEVFPKICNLRISDVTPDVLLSAINQLKPSTAEDLRDPEEAYRKLIQSSLPSTTK